MYSYTIIHKKEAKKIISKGMNDKWQEWFYITYNDEVKDAKKIKNSFIFINNK